jgi:hypothetical protein
MFYNQVYGRFTKSCHIRRVHDKALQSRPKIIATPVLCIFLIDWLQKFCTAFAMKIRLNNLGINVLSVSMCSNSRTAERFSWNYILGNSIEFVVVFQFLSNVITIRNKLRAMKCVLSMQATEQLRGQNTVPHMRIRVQGPSLSRQVTSCNILHSRCEINLHATERSCLELLARTGQSVRGSSTENRSLTHLTRIIYCMSV